MRFFRKYACKVLCWSLALGFLFGAYNGCVNHTAVVAAAKGQDFTIIVTDDEFRYIHYDGRVFATQPIRWYGPGKVTAK